MPRLQDLPWQDLTAALLGPDTLKPKFQPKPRSIVKAPTPAADVPDVVLVERELQPRRQRAEHRTSNNDSDEAGSKYLGSNASVSSSDAPLAKRRKTGTRASTGSTAGRGLEVPRTFKEASKSDMLICRTKKEGKDWETIQNACKDLTGRKPRSTSLQARYSAMYTHFAGTENSHDATLLEMECKIDGWISDTVSKDIAQVTGEQTRFEYSPDVLRRQHNKLEGKDVAQPGQEYSRDDEFASKLGRDRADPQPAPEEPKARVKDKPRRKLFGRSLPSKAEAEDPKGPNNPDEQPVTYDLPPKPKGKEAKDEEANESTGEIDEWDRMIHKYGIVSPSGVVLGSTTDIEDAEEKARHGVWKIDPDAGPVIDMGL